MFCYGDSNNASTWSNVPFLMGRELEHHDITIPRVDISINNILTRVINRCIRVWLAATGHGNNADYGFIRSWLYRLLVEQKIAKAVKSHPKTDYCIFLCFDFYNKFSNTPSLVFSDWTYQMLIEERRSRPTDRFDRKFIAQQEEVLNKADVVLPLFSTTFAKLHIKYPNANVFHPGFNVINCMNVGAMNRDKITETKSRSNSIIFIGGPQYINGLKSLIESMSLLKRPMTLNVIGMKREMVPAAPDFVTFHGYLRKDIQDENHLYYKLLTEAKMIVNTTPLWGAYSSIVEGMYFYTPVIVSPFAQFTSEFGTNIDFGHYCHSGSHAELAEKIDQIASMCTIDYVRLCDNAHDRVKAYTWQRFVDSMLSIMSHSAKVLGKNN